MNTYLRRLSSLALALCALTLASCGGGGGGSATAGIEGTGISGIEGTGVALGPVTGFGSIFVNGVEYSTSSAQIRIDGSSATESQLKIGQIVTVKGSVNANQTTGTATEVSFLTSVQGTVAGLNTATLTFTVLGQTVRVNGTTLFDSGVTLDASGTLPQAGLSVEVSGFRNAAGDIVATRIEHSVANAEVELTGVVASLNSAASTFAIGTQVIDYSAATISNGTLANGSVVEVKGGTLQGNGALRARAVEIQSSLTVANNDAGKIQGIVTRFGSSTDFDVNGTKVSTTGSTVFTNNGLTLGLNIKVQVEGRFNASGVLVATKVELKPDNAIRVRGTIDSIDSAGNSLRVLGTTINLNSQTQIEDKSTAKVSPLRLAGLRAGDYVEVRGYENSGGTALVAVIFERQNTDNKVEIIATARSPADPNITVLGTTISLGNTVRFEGSASNSITRAEFFAQANGKLVRLRGTPNGSIVNWERADIQN